MKKKKRTDPFAENPEQVLQERMKDAKKVTWEEVFSHGGPRPGSGRKPAVDKKVPLTIYVEGSAINTLGKEQARICAIEAIRKKATSQ